MGVISGRIPERYFPPPFYSLPPGEGKVTFYEAVKFDALEKNLHASAVTTFKW